jgi:putative endonuclease
MRRAGAQTEERALQFLLARGLRLKARNYACRLGEIDLVLEQDDVTIFVEVRQRSSAAFGGAAGSITARKRARILATARHYLAEQGRFAACRFDAVLVDENGRLEWIRDAFGE